MVFKEMINTLPILNYATQWNRCGACAHMCTLTNTSHLRVMKVKSTSLKKYNAICLNTACLPLFVLSDMI